MKRGDCGCRNHLGKPKVKYPDKDSAMHALLTRHLRFGPHKVYPCPRMDGVFHIRSIR